MQVKSFIDVISSDSHYQTYKVVNFVTCDDMFSGDPMEHVCDFAGKTIKAPAYSLEEVKRFKERLTKKIGELENIVIIDSNRGKIFTDIKNDSFFERLAQNVEYFKGDTLYPLYQLKSFSEKSSIEKILTKAFPDPLMPINEEEAYVCTLF